jgi:hypothetical protein
MATSGTYNFNLDLGDAIEEAFERAGLELRSGYDYRTARRSINLLMLEWQNRGLNLWTVREGTQALTASDGSYPLDGQVFDIIEAFVRTNTGNSSNQFDQTLTSISISQYAHLANKLTEGKPLQYFLEKSPSGVTVNLWPVPDSREIYTLVYYYLERVEDAGSPASNNMDVPMRFLPCLVAGLAYQLSVKYTESNAKAPLLKAEYEEQWNLASDADREKASLRVTPGGYTF